MIHSFKATIYKAGINPCVDVPKRITDNMLPIKGYIPVKGQIKNYSFRQTLVPVRNAEYRLFIKGTMLKGADAKVTETIKVAIEQDFEPRKIPMPHLLKQKLVEHNLYIKFKRLAPSKQKEILNYLNYLKTEEALFRNIDKVIDRLKKKKVLK